MKTTSHFIGVELESELLSDLFNRLEMYFKEQKISEKIILQNPKSAHITLLYLHENLSIIDIGNIKNDIRKIDISGKIILKGFDYFYREGEEIILYIVPETKITLKKFRDDLYERYNHIGTENNNLDFISHVTCLRILDNIIFKDHKNNIEKIIEEELMKLRGGDINKKVISLYAVDSTGVDEIQVQI